jgi:hypothetical protein
MALTITALPTPPSRAVPSTFSVDADAFLAALPTFQTEANALAAEAETNSATATTGAATATTKAAEATASAASAAVANTATKWVSGTTYAEGVGVWSPIDKAAYRKITATAGGTVDPSANATDWIKLFKIQLVRSARTSNTILAAADNTTLIDITSGTFTQTFTAAATLGSGWFCYIRNSGTGDITLNPNASELIDGLTSYIMYPGECRLIQCTGTAFTSVVLQSFYKTFTTTGTFVKPPGYSLFSGHLWGGGASGERTGNIVAPSRGGSGAGCYYFTSNTSLFAASETITIGAGGAAVTGVAFGNKGGTSSIGSVATVTGSACSTFGNVNLVSGVIAFDATSSDIYKGGFGDRAVVGSGSVYGAGGGGGIDGANPGTERAGGTSVFAGSGGGSNSSTNGVDGTAPGGGGGATKTGTQSGAGAAGQCKIWGVV